MGGGLDTVARGELPALRDRKHVVSYWSSPDRGLHHLLLIWPNIVKRVPDAELRIFYHPDRFRRDVRGAWHIDEVCWRGQLLDQLMLKKLPSVKILGVQSRLALARHQAETKVWTYPCDPVSYTEGFGIAAGEAIAAGCYAVARPADALEEAYGEAIEWVRAPVCDADFRARFADAIVKGLLADDVPYKEARLEVLAQHTWANASENLENALT